MPEDYGTRFAKGQDPGLRLMKKMEHCANARADSTAIIATRLAERENAKLSLQKSDEVYKEALGFHRRYTEERWRKKLDKSPYLVDLGTEYAVQSEEQEIRRTLQQNKSESLLDRRKQAENQILQRAYGHGMDEEMAFLRAEKKELIGKEKELVAIRDKERTDARISRIRANMRKETQIRQAALAESRSKSIALHGAGESAGLGMGSRSATHVGGGGGSKSGKSSPSDGGVSGGHGSGLLNLGNMTRKQLLTASRASSKGGTLALRNSTSSVASPK
mmetsp:Transcript_13594/g.33428  ORF Transcript_13594/g.33428 Transcript_13594/m.33428 type:complete len:276 (+) Transcript_13594:181-1008(+)|eukprot:CAMPEP_0178986384 /NCGR_PEP_ID=MMETSP0795-20121207/2675_1 /TAXON_ID=88552 /ORGANISM="Amoebophrya sp., Strain Ameob2" /LENGTH=275 /DNA_ID=CAMNT_0020677441 /DNA_START=370 /DNA_END=1197 /DNA_ORIENTATION=-